MNQYIIEALGIFLGFFVQTIIGFGAQLITFPIHLTAIDFYKSNAIITFFFLLFSIIVVYKTWKDADKKIISELSISSIIGLIIGVYLLKYTSPLILKKLLGIFILADVAYEMKKNIKVESFKRLGLAFGFGGGIFAGLFASGGPLLVTYINNKLDTAKKIRATIIGILGLINVVRFLLLINTRIVTKETIIESMLLLPFFGLSLFLGHKMLHKIDEKRFKQLVYVFLILSGISLIIS